MDVLRHEIASRRLDNNNNDCSNDFLQSLLLLRSQQEQQSSADNDNNLLSDEQILDNILTLVIAGTVRLYRSMMNLIIFQAYYILLSVS
jgi:cytochrome P450